MASRKKAPAHRSVAEAVRSQIERGGERVWRLDDFSDLPFSAVAQALSRLTRAKLVERLSKGVYYRGRPTALGQSRPNPSVLRQLAASDRPMFPAGLAAAALLGFTTQSAARADLATSASNLPRKLVGAGTVVRTRRPAAWAALRETDAALLDFLRRRGRESELSPEDTIRRTLQLLGRDGCYRRLLQVAATEPPRVIALLGALGDQMGASKPALARLRAALNPLSRFDFGAFSGLPTAKLWQAKK
ncbi:MAG: hypothetical protein GC161_10315 [Planctomycetaceae bacterium]|nr:hypothetical protein [Planctomycetaceae bacterium]